jgi:hypothetical protein
LPPDLIEFQRDFAAAIDRPVAGAMAVYRNTVLHGAVEALRANYPVVEQIVGADMFEQVAVDYAGECPPRRPVLALYGERFADWLEKQAWIGQLPYLADVARAERLHVECLMSADAQPLAAPRVREICRQSSTRLTLHPSARFTWLTTPAMSVWLAHQHGFESQLDLKWEAEGALFIRPEPFVTHAHRIGRAAHRLLFGLRLGEPVSSALETAAQLYPQEDLTAVFSSLVNLGAFVDHPSKRIV